MEVCGLLCWVFEFCSSTPPPFFYIKETNAPVIIYNLVFKSQWVFPWSTYTSSTLKKMQQMSYFLNSLYTKCFSSSTSVGKASITHGILCKEMSWKWKEIFPDLSTESQFSFNFIFFHLRIAWTLGYSTDGNTCWLVLLWLLNITRPRHFLSPSGKLSFKWHFGAAIKVP